MYKFTRATTKEEYEAASHLFREYAQWLNIDLCFQNFDAELGQPDTMYAPPTGGIILCKEGEEYIGCVGIRKIDSDTAEMKRMWVRIPYQGRKIGTELLLAATELARECGYRTIRLDTLNTMTPAINLYRKNGFVEIPSYYHNPDPRAAYFEKLL